MDQWKSYGSLTGTLWQLSSTLFPLEGRSNLSLQGQTRCSKLSRHLQHSKSELQSCLCHCSNDSTYLLWISHVPASRTSSYSSCSKTFLPYLHHKAQAHFPRVHSFLDGPPRLPYPAAGLSLPSFGSLTPSSTALPRILSQYIWNQSFIPCPTMGVKAFLGQMHGSHGSK